MRLTRKTDLFKAIIVVLTCLACLGVFYHAGHFLDLQHPPEFADLIVVLAGTYPDRAQGAAALYHRRGAQQILLMRAIKPPGYNELLDFGIKVPEEWEINQQVLLALKVPSTAIKVMDQEGNGTIGEALLIKDYCRRHNIKKILLLTTRYHSRRAYITLRWVLPPDVTVHATPTSYDSYNPDHWWKTRRNIKNTLTEYAKLFIYLVELIIRYPFGEKL